MRSWRKNEKVFEEFEKNLADKNICTSCGHQGKLQSHTKAGKIENLEIQLEPHKNSIQINSKFLGCRSCGTSSGCDFSKFKEERLFIKNEVNVRSKALKDPNFPNEELIEEYSVIKDKVSKVDLKWEQPNLVSFVVSIC